MLRKFICFLGAACMALVMGVPAKAADPGGTIRVTPVWGGRTVAGGTVRICRVGTPVTGGYRITDGLANWTFTTREVNSGEFLSWIQEKAQGGRTAAVEGKDGALFTRLEAGLYLVTQTEAAEGYLALTPFLLELPEEGILEVTAQPSLIADTEPPLTGDRHIPILGAMGIGLSAAVLMVLADERKK